MHADHERYKIVSRRAALLAGGKFALFTALVGRMYYLQVVEADRYAVLADENRINMRILPPQRGLIVDRFGEPVAVNRQDYRVVIIAERAGDTAATLDALAKVIPLTAAERRRVLRVSSRRRRFVPVTVRESLTWEQVSRIEVNAPGLPGTIIEASLTRHYPYAAAAAHLVGYVGAVEESDLTGDPLLELPDFRMGRSGIERFYDRVLRGSAGAAQVEINAHGRVIRELSRREGATGKHVALALDMGLQAFAAERLGDESGSAVVLDLHTGQVLALVSTPSFDPNTFSRGIKSEEWRALVTNPRAPLSNKAVAGQYAPGSTFKIVVVLAALEAGVVTTDHAVYCPGYRDLGNARFHCWKRGGHGVLQMLDAIKQSCDVYFYNLAARTGIDRIAAMARRLGLGEKFGLNLHGERPGLIPTREWKRREIGEPWQKGETLIAGIGQGYILATPLQLAVMVARVANGGKAVVPRLVADDTGTGAQGRRRRSPPFPSIGVSGSSLAVVTAGMIGVVNEPRGTAYRSRISEPHMAMGGKTGTSQVRRISRGERERGVRKNKDLEWTQRDHALFVGFAPVESPRYAVAVVVEHGGGGSKAAAPVARDILLEAQRRNSARTGRARPVAESAPAGTRGRG